jgi:hypothetical protein
MERPKNSTQSAEQRAASALRRTLGTVAQSIVNTPRPVARAEVCTVRRDERLGDTSEEFGEIRESANVPRDLCMDRWSATPRTPHTDTASQAHNGRQPLGSPAVAVRADSGLLCQPSCFCDKPLAIKGPS